MAGALRIVPRRFRCRHFHHVFQANQKDKNTQQQEEEEEKRKKRERQQQAKANYFLISTQFDYHFVKPSTT